MKRYLILLATTMILCCVGFTAAQSAYLKLGEIEGESTRSGHEDWIVIDSFSHGLGQPQGIVTGATRRRAGVVIKDLVITKKVDKATPKLMELCAKGQVVPELELDVVTNDGRLTYKVSLKNVMVTSITTKTVCDPDCMMYDEMALTYSRITWEYWDNRGRKTEATYNVETRN